MDLALLPGESIVGLGLGGAILLVLVPTLLRAYARTQAGVWSIVAEKEAEIVRLRDEARTKDLEIEKWRGRAYASGWRPTP